MRRERTRSFPFSSKQCKSEQDGRKAQPRWQATGVVTRWRQQEKCLEEGEGDGGCAETGSLSPAADRTGHTDYGARRVQTHAATTGRHHRTTLRLKQHVTANQSPGNGLVVSHGRRRTVTASGLIIATVAIDCSPGLQFLPHAS